MAKKFSLEALITLTDGVTKPMAVMEKSVAKFGKNMQKNFGGVGKDIKSIDAGINKAAKGIAIGAGVALTAMGIIGAKAIDLASNLTEVQNVVDTTFGTEGAKKINAWSRTAISSFGLSELEAKKFNGIMGAMLKSSGLTGDAVTEMSMSLSGLAGDFASFYNLDAEDAFAKIRSGISGETEPLKQLGINMSVANLETFALTQGIKKRWSAMKQGEQIELRYAYLLKASTDAQGDFNKTLQTSWANQKRVIVTKFWDIMSNAVSKILPLLVEYGRLANDALDKISAWVEANKELIAIKFTEYIGQIKKMALGFVEWGKSVKSFIDLVVFLAPVILTLVVAIKAITLAMTIYNAVLWLVSLNPITLIIMAIIIAVGLLVAAIVWMVKNWDTVNNILIKIGVIIKDFFITVIEKQIQVMKNAGSFIITFGQIFLKYLLSPINLVISAIGSLLGILSKLPGVGDFFKGAQDGLKNFQATANKTLTGSAGTFDYKGTITAGEEKRAAMNATYASPTTKGAESRTYAESKTTNEVTIRADKGASMSTKGGPPVQYLNYGKAQ